MASAGATFGGMGDDQDRLLDEAAAVVKEQAFYMKRAIDNDNVRDALKHSSNIICELRTSLLSPKNYYELYMQVFQEMQHLSAFFGDKSRHNRKIQELYESVQHAGNILPRLYLLATVGATYIKSQEAGAKEILKDMHELCKGVQHPMRGLFLRYYLSQMVKDKLPDTGSEYEGPEGGNIDDAFDFIFSNLSESNRLWVRMQNQGTQRDKQKREKERHDLRVLVGANLVRLSQLDGITADYYASTALPKMLDHVLSVKDSMSQQYLLESMIQVFPDEYHFRTLEQVLAAYTKAHSGVDIKVIMVALLSRLANYLTSVPEAEVATTADVFSLIRAHLQPLLERALEPQGAEAGRPTPNDCIAPLDVQAAFMQFTVSLYPDRLVYVDLIFGSTADFVGKYFARVNVNGGPSKLSGAAAEKVVDLLQPAMKSLGFRVLELEHFLTLLGHLNFHTRKQVAISMATVMAEENWPIGSVEAVSVLFRAMAPLIKDEDDTPADEGNDKEAFREEQHHVCKLVHQIRAEDAYTEFLILSEMRKSFGQGGPTRLAHTLQPTCFGALKLVAKIKTEQESSLTVKKVFQFVHKTVTALVSAAPEPALQLWLIAAAAANHENEEAICYEFLTQALIVFEEEISESTRQYQVIFNLVGTLTQLRCLLDENFDTVSTKVTQHAARLLKKPLQVRAVANCSKLFWCDARREGKRVLECLQKCLKITDMAVQSDPKHVCLWVEMLDKYVYYVTAGCTEVGVKQVQSLMNLCQEHITFAENDASSKSEARRAKTHLQQTQRLLRHLKNSDDPEVAAKFAELELDSN